VKKAPRRPRAAAAAAAADARTWFMTWICTLLTVDDTGTTAATGSTGTEASRELLYSESCVALNLDAFCAITAATAAFCSVPRSSTTVVARMMTMPMHVVVTAVDATRRVALDSGEK